MIGPHYKKSWTPLTAGLQNPLKRPYLELLSSIPCENKQSNMQIIAHMKYKEHTFALCWKGVVDPQHGWYFQGARPCSCFAQQPLITVKEPLNGALLSLITDRMTVCVNVCVLLKERARGRERERESLWKTDIKQIWQKEKNQEIPTHTHTHIHPPRLLFSLLNLLNISSPVCLQTYCPASLLVRVFKTNPQMI